MEHLPGLILGLTALAIFFVVAFYITRKLKEAGNMSPSPSAKEMLARFSKMYDDGELSKEEFRAIRSLFTDAIMSQPTGSASSNEPADAEKEREARLKELLRSERR